MSAATTPAATSAHVCTAPALTIDQDGEHSLRTLWLPSAHAKAASTEHMNHLCAKSWAKARTSKEERDALNLARCAVNREYERVVTAIAERGGLLHFGAPALLKGGAA